MAFERFTNHGNDVAFTATVAIPAYSLVILSTDNEACELPASQYAWSHGIAQHAAAIGESVRVRVSGYSLLKVDGNAANLSVGDGITAHGDALGYGQKAAGAASRPVIAQAMAASTADGDVIPVMIARYLTTA
jgi:hypothetical protein